MAGKHVVSVFSPRMGIVDVAIVMLLLGEPLLVSMLVGGLIAIAGVLVVSRPRPGSELLRGAR